MCDDRAILGPFFDVLTAELTHEKTPDPVATPGVRILRRSPIREESKHDENNSDRAGATVGEPRSRYFSAAQPTAISVDVFAGKSARAEDQDR